MVYQVYTYAFFGGFYLRNMDTSRIKYKLVFVFT